MRGLYAIIDPSVCRSDPLEVAHAVLRGGCAALQLRDKLADDRRFLELARALCAACSGAGVPFFVNDRVWLAAELPDAGVHIGQADTPLAEVRRLLGRTRAIGLSTHTLEQAEAAERAGADLLGFGPVFATASKLDIEPIVGLTQLAQVCVRIRIPVVAIGGLHESNVAEVAAAGAPLGAAISAVCGALDPEESARRLHARLRAQA